MLPLFLTPFISIFFLDSFYHGGSTTSEILLLHSFFLYLFRASWSYYLFRGSDWPAQIYCINKFLFYSIQNYTYQFPYLVSIPILSILPMLDRFLHLLTKPILFTYTNYLYFIITFITTFILDWREGEKAILYHT